MNSKVKVCGDAASNHIVVSKTNPEFAHIRVEQTRIIIDDEGFGKARTVSALIPGKTEELKKFGWKAGQELPGKIIVKESMIAYNKKEPERDLKVAGDTGIVCKVDDKPIYRKHFYTFDDNAQDVIIEHTNKNEIKAFYSGASVTTVIEEEDNL
jgi:hypothetical protein